MTKAQATSAEFRYADLPILNKRVLRLGVAGNYGLTGADIHHAAEQGVRYWVWTPRFKQATPALREILNKDRDKHVVAIMGTAYTAGMVNRGVEKARRLLGTDFIDIYQVSWLGTGSFFSRSIQATLVANKNQGSVKALGCSIHDRKRAAVLARDSILDVLMIRYNAKHPGAETDIFPHLHHRQPIIVSYTATSWRQLLKPVKGIALQDFKKEKSNLVEEQKTLEIETTKLKSFVFLNDKVASSGLINAGDVEYIQISPHDKVAQR